MKLGYDNLEDAKSKLINTFALFQGKSFTIKNLWNAEGTKPEDNKFVVNGTHLCSRTAVGEISIDDPEFNCAHYNIGYVNQSGIAVWFFRVPMKQYKQGLNYQQVQMRTTNAAFAGVEFKHSASIGKMLENDYPTFKKASDWLSSGDAHVMAFNRNFAVSRDKIHKDFLLEYKGQQIGFTEDLKHFKLLEEHTHLLEALKEAAA